MKTLKRIIKRCRRGWNTNREHSEIDWTRCIKYFFRSISGFIRDEIVAKRASRMTKDELDRRYPGHSVSNPVTREEIDDAVSVYWPGFV
jgi:hypothetical protein